MTKRSFKAQSADGPMMFPALKMYYPRPQRITEDPEAIEMLSPGLRMAVRAMRSPWLRRSAARAFDRQTPGLWGGMVARKRYADDQVAAALSAGIRQFIILGAGFDTRSFRLIAPAGAEAYEVDLPANIARKERVLRRRFGRIPEHVSLVAVDFENDDLNKTLVTRGFQPDQPTMFVIEAVTQYLTEDAAEKLFADLSTAPASSRLIFTYVRQDFLDGDQLYGWETAHRKWVVQDRFWTYGIAPEAVGKLLARHGWTECEQVGAEEYRARYFQPAGRDLAAMDIERFVLAEKGI
jgi:methyltransferase (TIGR00027 family)